MKKRIIEATLEMPDGMSIIDLMRRVERAAIAKVMEAMPPAKPDAHGRYPYLYCRISDATTEDAVVYTSCYFPEKGCVEAYHLVPWRLDGGEVAVGEVTEVEPTMTMSWKPKDTPTVMSAEQATVKLRAGELTVEDACAVLERVTGRDPKAGELGVAIHRRIVEART